MNLTIQQVSKLTKLSVPTLYVYTSRQKLGKKVGNKKVFTQADVQKLLRGPKKSLGKKIAKVLAMTAISRKRQIKRAPIRVSNAKPKAAISNTGTPTPKPSFGTRLFRPKKAAQ
jgi:hypothetical protein